MSKIEVVTHQTRTRAEIQAQITPGVRAVCEESFEKLEMAKDPDHVRRFYRSLAHLVAKGVLENGGGMEDFAYVMKAAWMKESTSESLGEAILVQDLPKGMAS